MRTPRTAKCVFKGEIFDVYQWRQRMFDGSYATFERLKRPDTVQVLAEKDGRFVFLREQQPGMKRIRPSLPGGRVDLGETPTGAAKRELLEETGLVCDKWKLVRVYEPYSKIDWRIYLFAASGCKKDREPHPDPGEKIVIEYLPFDRLIDRLVNSKAEMYIDLYSLRSDKGRMERFLGSLKR